MTDELRAAAERLLRHQQFVKGCDHIWNAHKQCQWCHSMRRDVDVADVAQAYLAEHPADSNEPATPEWWESVKPEGEKIIQIHAIGCGTLLAFGGKCVCDCPTRRQVRCLAEACGVKLGKGC